MKKLSIFLMALLVSFAIGISPASAEYLSQYDKEIVVSKEEARYLADLMGLKGIPLGDETAKLSFEIQESAIAKLEKLLNTEIDHYYIWLVVDGKRVLGIDPPVPMW
jgi:MarR family transcriptional regulator, temperature-dependent positive regulator of motility